MSCRKHALVGQIIFSSHLRDYNSCADKRYRDDVEFSLVQQTIGQRQPKNPSGAVVFKSSAIE
jgi:hypothetical protein